MPQIRLETTVRHHPKFIKAGPEASWLYVCGIGYCQDLLTDGAIPQSALPQLGVDMARYYRSDDGPTTLGRRSNDGQTTAKRRLRDLADRLVNAGLWERTNDGWIVHDYLEHNNDAATVRAIIQKRKASASKGGKAAHGEKSAPETTRKRSSKVVDQSAKQIAQPESSNLAEQSAPNFEQTGRPDLDLDLDLGTKNVQAAVAGAPAMCVQDGELPDFEPDPEPSDDLPASDEPETEDQRPKTNAQGSGFEVRGPDPATPAQWLKLAFTVMAANEAASLEDWTEALKVLCARKGFIYDSGLVSDALARAEAMKRSERLRAELDKAAEPKRRHRAG